MKDSYINIVNFEMNDLDEAISLYHNTVKQVNSTDYSETEINLWLSRFDRSKWEQRVKNDFFIKATYHGRLVGFASLKNGQYIDLMYVDADLQGKGIATLMLQALFKKGISEGHRSFETHASKTAQPFFKSKGFEVIKSNTVGNGGMTITNYLMKLTFAELSHAKAV